MHLCLGEQLFQALSQAIQLSRRQVGEQLSLQLGGRGQGAREELLARCGQRDSEDATVLGRFAAPDQSVALERSDDIHHGLRANAGSPRKVGTRHRGRGVLEPEQHQKLRGGEIELQESGFGAASNGEFGALQQIDGTDGRGLFLAH